ncbi:hypothetical protein IAU60_004596 [Kwoniella sp. DSM 27419]
MPSEKKVKRNGFTFGPFEQILLVIVVMGFGYHILTRQEAARDRAKALAKAARAQSSKASSSASASSSSSASKGQPLSSADVRAGKMTSSSSSSSKRVGDPSPRHVSGGTSSRDDPSNLWFRKNYFLTMQGPGKPAFVPFQDGLRPKKGDPAGTLWWDNVPEASMKNPWAVEMLEKDIQMLKIAKQQKEEEERYAKVANLLQTILGFLLCAVDMRLGVLALVFFLWKHFTNLHDQSLLDEKDDIEKEKRELAEKIRDAKKAGMSSQDYAGLQMALDRLG